MTFSSLSRCSLNPNLNFVNLKIKLFIIFCLVPAVPAFAEDIIKDYYLNGGLGGAAYYFSAGEHSWDAFRVEITESYTIRRLRVKMRRVDCEESAAGCIQGEERIRPFFNARIYSHDAVNNSPGVLVGSVSSNTIDFNTDILSSTTSIYDRITPFSDVWFHDLNAPVEPGLYWLVIHNVNWANVYPNHLDHFIQVEAANIAPLGNGSIYGRALSYTAGNTENTASWSGKYTGQVNYEFYDDAPVTVDVYNVMPVASDTNGSIDPDMPQAVNKGSSAMFTITANSGYAPIIGGTCGGVLDGTIYTTNPVYADCTVTADFAPIIITHTVTPSSGANGSIRPRTPQTVNDGSRIRFTVTPNRGYAALVGGTCGGRLIGTIYTTDPVYSDCSVTARFYRRR